MNIRTPISRFRLRKIRIQNIRFLSSSEGSSGEGSPSGETGEARQGPNFSIHHFNPLPTPRSPLVYPAVRSVPIPQLRDRREGFSGIPVPNISGFSLPVFEGPGTPEKLDEFLHKYSPQHTRHQQSGPWIFVKKDSEMPGFPSTKVDLSITTNKGQELVKRAHERIESFDVVREADARLIGKHWKPSPEAYVREMERWPLVLRSIDPTLKTLAKKYGYTCGGWYGILNWGAVDKLFTELAHSLLFGDLGKTSAHVVKVTTAGHKSLPGGVHILSVIMKDCWDMGRSKTILDTLIRRHAWVPQAAKSDYYVQLGLGHLHRSKEHSCVWTPADFYSREEVETMRIAAKAQERLFTRATILVGREQKVGKWVDAVPDGKTTIEGTRNAQSSETPSAETDTAQSPETPPQQTDRTTL